MTLALRSPADGVGLVLQGAGGKHAGVRRQIIQRKRRGWLVPMKVVAAGRPGHLAPASPERDRAQQQQAAHQHSVRNVRTLGHTSPPGSANLRITHRGMQAEEKGTWNLSHPADRR